MKDKSAILPATASCIKKLLLCAVLGLYNIIYAQPVPEFWYDYKLKQMSLDEKIGQLFMVAAYSNKDAAHTEEIENLIRNYHIGGLIFFQNDPLKQAYLCNYFQSLSSTPLMIGIDGEWGLSMRLKNTQKFPYALTLGAIQNDSLVYRVGAAIGRQCRRLGIHINFAPDIDINSNPNNPIIGFRSFGDDKYRVARLGNAYNQGLLSEQVLSSAKHFPGHGDVYTDSHLDLPVVDKSLSVLDSNELYPFSYLIKEGVASVMVAHIHFPQLDSRPNRSASLSRYIVDTLLRQRMQFEGLIFTDAMNMKGVSKYYSPGHADLEAVLAGNDIILFSENVPVAISQIKEAVLNGKLSIEELDKRVLRILKWKNFAGLSQYKPIETSNLLNDLKGSENESLLQEVANACVGFAAGNEQAISFQNRKETIVVAIGEHPESQWKTICKEKSYKNFISIGKNLSAEKRNAILKKLSVYKNIIISLHQPSVWKQQEGGYTANDFALINSLAARHKVLLIGFCNPYIFNKLPKGIAVIAAYEDLEYYHRAAAAAMSGETSVKVNLPVKLNLGYKSPGTVGIPHNTDKLNEIDGIVQQLMMKKAAPGCRILVLKDGVEVFNRSYGYLNYDKRYRVNDSSMYDIASITKIAATTIAVMKLYDEGKIDLSKTLGDYVPRARGTNKEKLVLSDIMEHRAGLTAWIPFYKETLPYVDSIYCPAEDTAFCVKVADKFFMLKANRDTIYKRIFDSPLESREYRYSDLSMLLMQLVVEAVSGQTLDRYVEEQFYKPMGLRFITYNPWKKFDTKNIAPTQLDRLFRQQELCGYVHDPAAAMLGGVSGHAGIFSNTGDLAAIMQMLNDSGRYNNKQYLSFSTIQKFTAYQKKDSRRGLGFDKPDFSGKTSPASTLGSKLMFGHTGFTGTCAWADPQYGIVYVFLCNRICPIEENKELITGNYRTRIQDVIYKWLY